MKYLTYIAAFVVSLALVYAALIASDSFTPEAFSLLAAGVLAVVFEIFPGLRDQWDLLPADSKQLWMIGFLVITVYGAFGLSCAGIIVAFTCSLAGALDALIVLVIAIGANQGVHRGIKFIFRHAINK
jgi:hypothetical protein